MSDELKTQTTTRRRRAVIAQDAVSAPLDAPSCFGKMPAKPKKDGKCAYCKHYLSCKGV